MPMPDRILFPTFRHRDRTAHLDNLFDHKKFRNNREKLIFVKKSRCANVFNI